VPRPAHSKGRFAGSAGSTAPVWIGWSVAVLNRSVRVAHNRGVKESHAQETDRVRASRARLVARADDERREIERALHDGIQQDLVALAVKLQLARLEVGSGAGAAQLFDELDREVQEALDGVRALSETVYPASLETRGLREALLSASAAAGVSVRIDADGLKRYPPHLERAVYFCCREALTEAATDGAVPTLRIWEERDALCFEIAPSTGMLTELEDRIDTLRGRVTTVGTAVGARIPLF
jgi:signal transduction histidine kinase